MKGWKKVFHANGDQKKAGVATLISDKTGFEIKAMKWDKERHYIMVKGIINIYAPNIGACQYIRQMLTIIKLEIYSYIIIVEDINTQFTLMNR